MASATFVLDAVEKSSAFKCGDGAPHILLREVRNGTGFKRTERYADGLLVSLWPSRGVWFAGIEVKVSRRDWLSELKNPAKSADIQKWCRYWWLATAEGVARPEEIPEAWGWVEVSKKGRLHVRKSAPPSGTEPLTVDFVASILRNRSAAERKLIDRAKHAARAEALAESSAVDENELHRLRMCERDLELLQKRVKEFESGAGVGLGAIEYQGGKSGRTYQIASLIESGARRTYGGTAARLRHLADVLEEAESIADARNKEAREAIEQVKEVVANG